MTLEPRYWEHKTLDELNDAEWEALCDGCGRCCLQKLEDDDTGEVHFTDIACRLLDQSSCRCQHYAERFKHVSDCLSVRPLTPEKLGWLPSSCAYKRLSAGLALAAWHPLVSGDLSSVHKAGISIAGRCVSETSVPILQWTEHVVVWPEKF